MPVQLIIALAVIAASFLGGWQANGWRHEAKEKARVEQDLENQRAAARADNKRQDTVIAAQNAAAARAVDLRRDADSARSELERVRSVSDAAVAAARVSQEACVERAAALNDVFKSCAGRYAELGEKADRHVSDIKTLNASWPKE